jgi:N6-adenosine-specific RNA methylase IME4
LIPFPEKKYKIIYADPPWEYENKKTGGTSTWKGNSAANAKYDVMDINDICNLPIQEISSRNCCLFLWATTPLLPEAFEVMDSWGFKYKTAIYWRKIMSLGMGYWFRGQVEVCLFGIKGTVPAFRCQKPNFIQSRVGDHSRKPKEFRGLITQLAEQHNLNPKIELFSREKIEGWDCWGNEIPTSEQRLL